MPFSVIWSKHVPRNIESLVTDTPFGLMRLVMADDAILDANWLLAADVAATGEHPALTGYWQHPQTQWPVKLLQTVGTAHQQKIWQAMTEIPPGQTLSYGVLAAQVGTNARVVGNACRANPFVLFVPCHRVVGASGAGGYCGHTEGPWLALKQKLLAFEAGLSAKAE